MTEIRFYHLQRMKLEAALPKLLEEALKENIRVVVEAPSREAIEALDERLWTYSDESFLPHGLASGDDPQSQPIVLVDDDSNPNGAAWRILVNGARLLPAIKAAGERPPLALILLFDGADADSRAAAREQWRETTAAGHVPSYWREDDFGAWRRER
jgi:DNA polymerase III subunit chi